MPKIEIIYPGQNDGRIILNAYLRDLYPITKVLYAVTLSLAPSEKKILSDKKLDKFKYLGFKLEYLGYSGIIVGEYTKKKVEHVHGIVYGDTKELNPHKSKKTGKLLYFTDKRLDVSNVVKPLDTEGKIKGWSEYIMKEVPSVNIMHWLELYENDQANQRAGAICESG